MTLRFTKMHGAGNDFVVLDLRGDMPPPTAALCRALADRHTGVGCDQILTVERADNGAAARYRIWNADGSSSQQCGNGARCIAAWVVRDSQSNDVALSDEFVLDSPVGAHAVTRLDGGRYRIEMGLPRFAPSSIPLHGFEGAQDEYVLYHNDAVFTFGAVSMGNPHAVIEVDDVDHAPVEAVAPMLQSHPAFPESVNVGFAQVESRQRIRLRVYERGVGETLACGSGACAAAAVLMRRGRVDRDVIVALPGGELRIQWPADDAPLTMSGPTAFVYEGEWTS
jgi:diaminopimelate epimerase